MSNRQVEPGGAWPPDPLTVDPSDPDWLTVKQAAGIIRKSKKTIERFYRKHDISIMYGGTRLISHRRLMGVFVRHTLTHLDAIF